MSSAVLAGTSRGALGRTEEPEISGAVQPRDAVPSLRSSSARVAVVNGRVAPPGPWRRRRRAATRSPSPGSRARSSSTGTWTMRAGGPWRRVTKWYETNPGDNLEPKVRERRLPGLRRRLPLRRLRVRRPGSGSIRAPFGDRDNVPRFTDYGGVILDTRHDGRTGVLMLANAHNIQYDSVHRRRVGERGRVAGFLLGRLQAKITEQGLDARDARSRSRRCATRNADPQTWGIMLYRNYPRDRHYQFFTTRLPRGSNCFVCHSNVLTGLKDLPRAGTSSRRRTSPPARSASRGRARHAARQRALPSRAPAST